jgi:hypothetical protein
MLRALRGSRLPFVLGAAAAVSGCVCCTGGLADALSAPVAIGFLSAAVVFGVAAAVVASVRIRRPFRAVRGEVTERLERLRSLHTAVVRPDGESSTVTGYRIGRIDIDWSDGDAVATVVAILSFDDGSEGRLHLQLLPHDDDRWEVAYVEGAGFRLALE